MNKTITLSINKELDGTSVKSIVKHTIKLSASLITELKKVSDGITLDGVRVTVRAIAHDGQTLCLHIPEDCSSQPVPVDLPVDIVYEDDDIVVVNKPPYMPTHPSHGHQDDTLANALSYYYRDVARENGGFVFRALNRLDRNTSGIVCVAKNKYAAALYGGLMAQGKIRKKYIAIVDGDARALCGSGTCIIDNFIRRERESIITRCICSERDDGAAHAVTELRTIGVTDDGMHSIVELLPRTGRTHQLRVHLAHAGFPITGDGLYGEESPLIARHALHAASIVLPTPSGEMALDAPLPQDMQMLITTLGACQTSF